MALPQGIEPYLESALQGFWQLCATIFTGVSPRDIVLLATLIGARHLVAGGYDDTDKADQY